MTEELDIEDNSAPLTPELIRVRLKRALQKDGDFPASAKIVNEIYDLTKSPRASAEQISEIILREPSLGIRVLNLVNSAFFGQRKEIVTISQAVMQIGMQQLADLCSSLVVVQKFVPAARRGGILATCLRNTAVTSLLLEPIAAATVPPKERGKNQEAGQLLGWFAEMGTLLLAFYFPQLFDRMLLKDGCKMQDIERSVLRLTGRSSVALGHEVIKDLGVPSFYPEVLEIAARIQKSETSSFGDRYLVGAARALNAASYLAAPICDPITDPQRRMEELDRKIDQAARETGMERSAIHQALKQLPKLFKDYCDVVDLSLDPLPDFLSKYSGESELSFGEAEEEDSSLTDYIIEMKQAVDQRESTISVISTALEALVWGLGFSRAILLILSTTQRELVGRMALGDMKGLDPKKITRPLMSSGERNPSPDSLAFHESRPIYDGASVLTGGGEFAAIPVGFGKKVLGVIYADKLKGEVVSTKDKAAINTLAELLDRSVKNQ